MPKHTQSPGGIQRGPRRADNFTILSNEVLNDSRLSFRARGVLIWLLSKPADWRTRSDAIAGQTPEGRESVRAAMRELEAIGYLVREKVRDAKTGRISTIQTIFEEPVEVTKSQVIPAPRKPVTRVAENGEPGLFTKNRSPRTETNNHTSKRGSQRQCAANPAPSLSGKLREIRSADDQKLADLEAATLAEGLAASYGRIKAEQRTAILELIDLHGIPSLVDATKRAHRPDNPTMHVHGWVRLWRSIPLPLTARAAEPLCGVCVEGWLPEEDEQGRAVRCTCRTAVAA